MLHHGFNVGDINNLLTEEKFTSHISHQCNTLHFSFETNNILVSFRVL
jgi:hypothetical protein